MTEERFLDRNKQFLQFDSQQFTHSRHENIVDLRKKKRSQHLAKRRAINSNMTDRLDFDGNEILVVEQMNDILLDFCPDLGKEDLDDLSKLAIIKQIIENNPPINILDLAIFTVRHIISRKHGPPIGAFLNIGYGKLLIGLLDYKYGQNIPLEAAWSICNLLSGPHEYAEVLYKLDVIPALMRITCPESPLVSEHTLWGLSNLAGDCHEFRHALIVSGYIDLLDSIVSDSQIRPTMSLLKVVSWSLSNVSRGSDFIEYNNIQKILGMVSQMINLDDDEIYSECLWTLAYICKSHNEKIQMVLEADFVFFIVNGLNSTLESILAPCIRLACHISSGYNSQTQRLLDENILDLLEKHLQGYNDMILKELYLALSNIAGGSLPQVQFLFNHPIFEKSLRALNHPSFNVRLEASIYIKNFCIVGRPINLAASLIDLNIHGILSQSLTESDTNYLANILEIIKFVLEADTSKKSKTLFEESGCKDLIEKLTTNLNPKVYQQSNEIIESYFLVQEDPELDFKHTTVQTFNLG